MHGKRGLSNEPASSFVEVSLKSFTQGHIWSRKKDLEQNSLHDTRMPIHIPNMKIVEDLSLVVLDCIFTMY